MADISTELAKFRSAVYGEEVRGALISSIVKMNEEAEHAEAWATGGNTEDPGGGSVPGTENNAKYYAELGDARARAWADGTMPDGTPIPDTDPAYGKTARGYAEAAAQSAAELELDPTLTQATQAAQAKAVGDRLDAAEAEIDGVKNDLAELVSYELTQISDTVIAGKYICAADGSIRDANNQEVTDYVDVTGIDTVAITASATTNRFYYAFYDASKNYLADSGRAFESGVTLEDEIVTVPAGAKYCVAMWYNKTSTHDPVIKKAVRRVNVGTISGSVLEDGTVGAEKLKESALAGYAKTVPSKNLFNPADVTEDAVLAQNSNQTSASTSYDTSGFIPVKGGKTYTISPKCRIYCVSTGKTADTVAEYNNQNVSTARTVTVVNDGYIRISVSKGTQSIQVEEGSAATPYVPYGKKLESGVSMNGDMQAEAAEIAANVLSAGNAVSVTKNGSTLTISSALDGKDLRRVFLLTKADKNGAANFVADYLDGAQIKEAEDDIAPLRIRILENGSGRDWTVGANHAWPCLKAAGTPLSAADIGSVWSNGTLQFTVIDVDETGGAVFLYPCAYTDGKPAFLTTPDSGTFTHVSGGDYTTAFDVASPSAKANLYPAVNSRFVTLTVGGTAVEADGVYAGESCIVTERYSIVDYTDLIAQVQAQGTDFDVESVDALVTVQTCYEFRGNVCNITQTVIADKAVELGNCGFLQATTLPANGGTVYAYCNHVASGALASAALVSMSSFGTTAYATAENCETGKVPNRFVEINKLNGAYRYAFLMGFYSDKSDGSDTARSTLTTYMELRNTKKMYPRCVDGKTLAAGESVTVAGYRAYQGPTQLVSEAAVRSGKSTYILADAQTTGRVSVAAPGLVGAEFETADSSGITVPSDVVGPAGIDVIASGSAQSATFKI